MSYHEAFWLVTGTAAPVIALAAVVALPDASAFSDTAWQLTMRVPTYEPSSEQGKLKFEDIVPEWQRLLLSLISQVGSFGNVVLQAALLAVSLSALATGRDLIPVWLPIVAAVTGILLLTLTALTGLSIRRAERVARRKEMSSRPPGHG